MYLESILVLSQTHDEVHSVDVANYLGYSKPSVSRAVGVLRDRGLLDMDEHAHLILTEAGRAIAEKVYERHLTIAEFLGKLGVQASVAEADACRIEHIISDETFRAIKAHLQ